MSDKFVFEYTKGYEPTTRVSFHEIPSSRKMGREVLERFTKEGVQYLEENPDVHTWHGWSGDTLVLVTRDEDAIEILVACPTMHGYVNKE